MIQMVIRSGPGSSAAEVQLQIDLAQAQAVDADGNVYVVGSTQGTLPGHTSAGGVNDAFVRKYDANGTEVWTKQFGTSRRDEAYGISIDGSNVYVSGFTDGTFLGQTKAGGYDAFIRKYDSDGNDVWTRQFGTSGDDQAREISVDPSGVYVTGWTRGTLQGQVSLGGIDAFVRKYDSDGNDVWTRQFGTSGNDLAGVISVDGSGVYVTGSTLGTFSGQTSAGGHDAFVRKYDADGNEVWTRQFGSSSHDYASGISVDASGVYVTGFTEGTIPGQTSAGRHDAFVRKYDANGTEVWTRQFGTSSYDYASGIYVNGSGVYVTGYTGGIFSDQTRAGGWDAFVRKYDVSGAEVWTHQFGTLGNDWARGISVVGSDVYVAGWTNGTFPGQTSIGVVDVFVVKIRPHNSPPIANAGADVVVDCEGSSGNQVTLDGSGSSDPDDDPLTYTWTGPFPEGGGTVTGVSPTVTLSLGTSTINLVVNDGTVDSAPDDMTVSVNVSAEGFSSPLGSLVQEGETVPLPDKSFKQGRVLPLRFQLFCGTTLIDGSLTPPRIVELRKMGSAVNLEILDLDPGLSNDDGLEFKFEGTEWIYRLSTKDLSTGTYEIVVEMPDGKRFVSAFVLR
jgi:hypothetical protein